MENSRSARVVIYDPLAEKAGVPIITCGEACHSLALLNSRRERTFGVTDSNKEGRELIRRQACTPRQRPILAGQICLIISWLSFHPRVELVDDVSTSSKTR